MKTWSYNSNHIVSNAKKLKLEERTLISHIVSIVMTWKLKVRLELNSNHIVSNAKKLKLEGRTLQAILFQMNC